jgi:hypothetical protein
VKGKSITVSRFTTAKWAQIAQIRMIAGREFSPALVFRYTLGSKRCFTCTLTRTSKRLFKKIIDVERNSSLLIIVII